MGFKKTIILIVINSILNIGIFSQIIEITPPFPTTNDIITIHYDATKGNGGLIGVSPVYTHTGVVTQSGLPSSWSYVQGNWGQADPNVLMTDLGNNIHEIVIDIDQYYGFPANTKIDLRQKHLHLPCLSKLFSGKLNSWMAFYKNVNNIFSE